MGYETVASSPNYDTVFIIGVTLLAMYSLYVLLRGDGDE